MVNPNDASTHLDRKELQKALKEWGVPASGTTVVLRERYNAEYNKRSLKPPPSSSSSPSYAAAASVATAAIVSPPAAAVATASTKAAKKPPEKRLRRYRKHCTSKILDRIDRARTQKMFLVECGEVEDLSCTFAVLGSTGNHYDVKIEKVPSCTCPDHAKGNLCKHILFVLLKVMGIDHASPLIYQAAWITPELQEMFGQMEKRFSKLSGAVMANQQVRSKFQKLKHGIDDDDDDNNKNDETGVARKQAEGEDCAICYDTMKKGEILTYCRGVCGGNFHKHCINQWLSSQRSSKTCPLCRQEWVGEGNTKNVSTQEGYTNLGQLQGQSQTRDTSTYSEWYGHSKRRRYY